MISLGLLVLRVVIGGIFALHGYTKVFGGKGKSDQIPPEMQQMLGSGFMQSLENGGFDNTTSFMQGLGIPNPKLAAAVLAATELGGGVALVFGWMTRPAALALLISQIVAVEKVHGKKGLIAPGGYEFNASLIAAVVCLMLAGPGVLSLD